MLNDISRVIAEATESGEITGASFAYWDGDRMHKVVGGKRNSVTGDPVTLDTLMHIGSITKVLNAVLFMQLVDDGLISLDDPVTKHLPELELGEPDALPRITCRMLVNHTNGIDYDAPQYHPFDEERIEDAVRRCAGKRQLHAPGEATSYSNIGTVIAGYMVQKLRGEGWYDLVKTRIFEPLGLQHALADITLIPRFRVSVGDQVNVEGKLVQSERPFLPHSFGPAGATVMMTAEDLVNFARALLNGGQGVNGVRILSEESARLMRTPTAKFGAPTHEVGLGWIVMPSGVLTHGGGGPGVASELYAHPESGRAFALLTNCAKMGPFQPAVYGAILESWGAAPVTPAAVPNPADLTPYEGTYENSLIRLEIFAEGQRLLARMSFKVSIYETLDAPQPAVELFRIGDRLFKGAGLMGYAGETQLGFINPGADGRMQGIATGYRVFMRASPAAG